MKMRRVECEEYQPVAAAKHSILLQHFLRHFTSSHIFSFFLLSFLHFLSPTSARGVSTAAIYRPTYPPYHTYEAYRTELLQLAEEEMHRDTLRVMASREKTFAGETLYLTQLGHWHKEAEDDASTSSGSSSALLKKRLKVLISFGEHARELVTVESYFHLMHYILSGASDGRTDCDILGSGLTTEESDALHGSPDAALSGVPLISSRGYRARWVNFILDELSLDLIGVTNPDGKIHVEKTGDWCWRNTGRNVDLNRNGAWEFGGEGSGSTPDHEEYRGKEPFSEAETRFIRDLQLRNSYDAYISVHSGEQQLFVPFVDTRSKREHRRRAETAKELALCQAIVDSKHMGGWLHDSGIGYERNDYTADGTIMDYMAGIAKVPLVFCVELWGGPIHNDCFVQFNPDSTPVMLPGKNGKSRKTSALEKDLGRMHVFYIEMLNKLVAHETGHVYRDPLEEPAGPKRDALLARAKRTCQVENALYSTQRDLRLRKVKRMNGDVVRTNPKSRITIQP